MPSKNFFIVGNLSVDVKATKEEADWRA